jgi:hypothetical protein
MVYLLVFHACINEMHGSGSKISSKYLVRQGCTEGVYSGVKGLILIRYKERNVWWFNHIARIWNSNQEVYGSDISMWHIRILKNVYLLFKGIQSTY